MQRNHNVAGKLIEKVDGISQPSPIQNNQIESRSQEWSEKEYQLSHINVILPMFIGIIALGISLAGLAYIMLFVSHSRGSGNIVIILVLLLLFLAWLVFCGTGIYFFLYGLSARKSRVILGKTQFAVDPLFWKERVVISYQQLIDARMTTHRSRRDGIVQHTFEIRYHPRDDVNNIDWRRIHKLTIEGIGNKMPLQRELQKRASAPIPKQIQSEIDQKKSETFSQIISGKRSQEYSTEMDKTLLILYLIMAGIIVAIMLIAVVQ